jgi:hypothetical protein
MDQNYVTLISTANKGLFRNNKSNHFVNQLDTPINLNFDFKVGLASILLGDFVKTQELNNLTFKYEVETQHYKESLTLKNEERKSFLDKALIYRQGRYLFIDLKRGHVLHIHTSNGSHKVFLNDKDSILEQNHFQDQIPINQDTFEIEINELQSEPTQVSLDPDNYLNDFKTKLPSGTTLNHNELKIPKGTIIQLSSELANLLGLEQEILDSGTFSLFPYELNKLKEISAYHIYTNIITSNHVGHTKAPLLRAVTPIGGKLQDFQNIYYHPLKTSSIQQIEILITTDKGLQVDLKGATHVILHFKK